MVHNFYVLRILCLTQGSTDFILLFLLEIFVLALMLNFVGYFLYVVAYPRFIKFAYGYSFIQYHLLKITISPFD